MDYERYQRHFSLIGIDGQTKLSQASVLIVGCGGVGSPVSLYLTAAGIGRIGLIDHDVVDLSNLQRQILFNENDLNKSKVLSAEAHLKALNSEIDINTCVERLDQTVAEKLFPEYDLIIDGSDNFQTRYLVNDICCQLNKPFISASVLKTQAQIGFFDIKSGCYRCLFPDAPPSELIPNCAEAGVLGSIVGVIGTMAATLALNYFIKDSYPSNAIKIFDSETLSIKNLSYAKSSDCVSCVQKKYIPLCANKHGLGASRIIKKSQVSADNYYIVDVREHWERSLGHIEFDHLHLPKSQVNSYLSSLHKNTKILCYCKSGMRSQQVVDVLLKNGFDAYSLKGGYTEWVSS
ncbi:HesA/MoeB/ThiF family protein [Francisellaceae bacterium]|nr:HesA/MoeB/ThiF family protein [Francisellaceae bacterium]